MNIHQSINFKSRRIGNFAIIDSMAIRRRVTAYGEQWIKQAFKNELFAAPKFN